MYPFDKDNPLRIISTKLLLKPLLWTGISANTVSVIGFCFGLIACYFFAKGHNYRGLLFTGVSAMFDYCDGSVARIKGQVSPKGQYIDTSLDYLYLMLIILSISYYNNVLIWGYLVLISITFGNWVQYNGNVNIKLPFPLTIQFIIPISVLMGCSGAGIALISTIQAIRTLFLYWRSLCLISNT